MKVALAQLNTTVGDLVGNEAKILAAYRRGAAAGVDLVVTPELATTGYPPRDLLLKPHFVAQNLALLERLAAATGKVGLLVGFVGRNVGRPGRGLTNSVALLQHGRIAEVRTKSLLPTYDVFDEDRYFDPAEGNEPVLFNGQRIGVTVCVSQVFMYMAMAIAPVTMVQPLMRLSNVLVIVFSWFMNREYEIFDPGVIVAIGISMIGAVALGADTTWVIQVLEPGEGLARVLAWKWPG